MTTYWQEILEQQATLTSDASSASTHTFMPLNEIGVIHVSGDEAQSFMQNLFTNDVNALAINQSQLSGFCNAKGRLFAIFKLVRHDDHYQIILPKSMCSTLQQRLSMFILRTKVTITDESESSVCIGLHYPDNVDLSNLNLSENLLINDEKSCRSLYISTIDNASELIRTLQNKGWSLGSDSSWEQRDIEAGLPTVIPETKEKFTPQQVNLDLLNGVSFNKGCYPGQEVVARLHYLGKPSRRMFIATMKTNNPPSIGSDITTADGSIAGQIVRAVYKGQDTVQLLLSLKLTERDSSLLFKEDEVFVDDSSAEF